MTKRSTLALLHCKIKFHRYGQKLSVELLKITRAFNDIQGGHLYLYAFSVCASKCACAQEKTERERERERERVCVSATHSLHVCH